MMLVGVGWLLILWFGLLVVGISVGGLFKRLETTLCYLVRKGFGLGVGFNGL